MDDDAARMTQGCFRMKLGHVHSYTKSQGFSTLLTTLVVMISIIVFAYTSSSIINEHQIATKNDFLKARAFNAAQAGLDYSIPYLDKNYNSITDGTTMVVQFTNGSFATVRANFENGKDLIQLVSVGRSSSNGESRSLQQRIQYQVSHTSGGLKSALQSQGNVTMTNNAIISDTSGNKKSIITGGGATLTNNAYTLLSTGVASNYANIGPDIDRNNTQFGSKNDTLLFNDYLGAPMTTFQNESTSLNIGGYSGAHTYNSEIDNKKGVSISITQSNGLGSLSNNAKLGAVNSPVVLVMNLANGGSFSMTNNTIVYGKLITKNGPLSLNNNVTVTGDLIVEGNLTLGNNVIINGDIISTGTVTLTNNAKVNGIVFSLGNVSADNNAIINGAVLSGGTTSLKNNAKIIYDAENAKFTTPGDTNGGSATASGYGKISGSWSDL